MSGVKRTHEKFTFSAPSLELSPKAEDKSNQHMYSEEPDPIKQMVKRIMYAEGDSRDLSHECAVYLKDTLIAL